MASDDPPRPIPAGLSKPQPPPPISFFPHPFWADHDGFAGGRGDGPEHALVDLFVEGVQAIPVGDAQEAVGEKAGHLVNSVVPSGREARRNSRVASPGSFISAKSSRR